MRAGVADLCVRFGPGLGLQTCACGTGLADGGVTPALLDLAFSLSRSISISFLLARFLSLSHARSFSLSLSLSLSLSYTHKHVGCYNINPDAL